MANPRTRHFTSQYAMPESPDIALGQMFYTGTSDFLVANEYFVRAMLAASSHCAIHASEDIVDANGLKLWASGQPIGERLLERLSNRKLRKPIELCVHAADPVAVAGIVETIEQRVSNSFDLGVVLEGRLTDVLRVVGSVAPSPTELMLLSVMRHCGRDMLGHAATVTALALTAMDLVGVHPELRRPLIKAALMHDIGELYLPPSLFDSPGATSVVQIRKQRRHAAIGGQIAIELARSGRTVGQLIAQSHERPDGRGYPLGLTAADLSLPAQALQFAEAMVELIECGSHGLRRAAVAARLVPGEFAQDFVNWIVGCAKACPPDRVLDVSTDAIALDLRQAHSVLGRTRLLLEKLDDRRETKAVQLAAAQWCLSVQGLIDELSRTGVDSALNCNIDIEPQDELEMIELGVLSHELLYRVRELCIRVELQQEESPELASSSLVIELLEILRACEPSPERSAADGRSRIELLPWSELYCVGVQEIDEQHRVLVRLLNRLAQSAYEGSKQNAVDETLLALVEYVRSHFKFEEDLMRTHGYESIKSHSEAHGRLIERLQRLIARQNTEKALSIEELMTFLRQWLISHILHTDKALALALNEKGIH